MAGCIIAKLPPSWRNFATTLKHKRHEISFKNLIASLDVEEKSRAKDTNERGGEGQSSTNTVQKDYMSRTKETSSSRSISLQRLLTSRRRRRRRRRKCTKLGREDVTPAESLATIPRTAQNVQIAKEKMAPRLSMS